eukprot:scaffold47_cov258-Pinguiococcus_pyrenoidosus.AAC.85
MQFATASAERCRCALPAVNLWEICERCASLDTAAAIRRVREEHPRPEAVVFAGRLGIPA